VFAVIYYAKLQGFQAALVEVLISSKWTKLQRRHGPDSQTSRFAANAHAGIGSIGYQGRGRHSQRLVTTNPACFLDLSKNKKHLKSI
jgi:hypothetical protein